MHERGAERLERVADPVFEGLDSLVGVVLGEERADPGTGADLQAAQLAVVDRS